MDRLLSLAASPSCAAALWVFWVGACLGSFVNVVAYRLPKGQSLVRPRSRCTHCRRLIAFYDNIPVFSWFWLRGRCRHCRGPISPRYPAVEFAVGALALGLWLRWGGQPWWAAAAVLACAALTAVALIDWDTFLIPDELSLGLLAAGWLCAPWNPLLAAAGARWDVGLWASARGSLAGFAICWLTAEVGERIFGREAMGGGDIKLLAAVGAWGGALGAFDCLMIASVLGSLYGVIRMARGTLRRSEPIPFGPFLSAGAAFNFFCLLPLGFPFS